MVSMACERGYHQGCPHHVGGDCICKCHNESSPTKVGEKVLSAAQEAVAGGRRQDYGEVAVHFQQVANLWNAYLGTNIIRHQDVPLLMVLYKLSREAHRHKLDNLVDVAGYAAVAGELYADD